MRNKIYDSVCSGVWSLGSMLGKVINHPYYGAVCYALLDTFLYTNSINKFSAHLDESAEPITELKSEKDQYYLSVITVFSFATLLANYLNAYVMIKNANKNKTEKVYYNSKPVHIINLMSISFKAGVTTTSAFAFVYDYTRLIEVLAITPIFFFIGNFLAQISLHFETSNSRFNFPCQPVKEGLGFIFGGIIYNGTVQMLAWNTINNFLIEADAMDVEDRNTFNSPWSVATVVFATIFFPFSLYGNYIRFPSLIVEKFSKEEGFQKKRFGCCSCDRFDKVAGIMNSVVKTSIQSMAAAAMGMDVLGHSDLAYTFTALSIGVCIPGVLTYYKEQLSIKPKLSMADNNADQKPSSETPRRSSVELEEISAEEAELIVNNIMTQTRRSEIPRRSSVGVVDIFNEEAARLERLKEPLLTSANEFGI